MVGGLRDRKETFESTDHISAVSDNDHISMTARPRLWISCPAPDNANTQTGFDCLKWLLRPGPSTMHHGYQSKTHRYYVMNGF